MWPVPSDDAHADIKDIRTFLKYFNDLVATEVYNDVLFVSEKNEHVSWYDGERIAFRTPNYTKILNAMRTQPTLTLADMKEITGISIAAIQKLLDQLIQKKYVERGEKDGSWRVFVVQWNVSWYKLSKTNCVRTLHNLIIKKWDI